MLASLLPGLRDVRVPLVVGYLLFIAALITWVDVNATGEPIFLSENPRLGPIIGGLSDAALVTAASFCAYIVGVVFVREPTFFQLAAEWMKFPKNRFQGPSTKAYMHAMRESRAVGVRNASPARDRPGADQSELVPQLLVANQTLYGEYDRFYSESSFRLNLALPLLLAGLALVHCLDASAAWSVALLPVSGYLLYTGLAKASASQEVLAHAVMRKMITHPDIEESSARRSAAEAIEEAILVRPFIVRQELSDEGRGRGGISGEYRVEIENRSDGRFNILSLNSFLAIRHAGRLDASVYEDIGERPMLDLEIAPRELREVASGPFGHDGLVVDWAVDYADVAVEFVGVDHLGKTWERDRTGAWRRRDW